MVTNSSVNGNSGDAGPQGTAGGTGANGSVGPTGPSGAAGTAGVAGAAGPTGPTGVGSQAFRGGLVLPWSSFQYTRADVCTLGACWYHSTNPNGPSTTATASFGSASIWLPVAGTWKMTVAYPTETYSGIGKIVINGVTTTIDQYGAGSAASKTWTQTLAAGVYSVAVSTNFKNAASSDYWVQWYTAGLMFQI